MPASRYYAAVAAVAGAFLVVVGNGLRDDIIDSPWAAAGAGAGVIVAGLAVVREFVVRDRRRRSLEEQRQRKNQSGLTRESRRSEVNSTGKLTVENNASLIAEIKRRSDAANVLSKVSEAHREVFELCAEYLNLIEGELNKMNPGSPRLEPFLKGRTRVADAHRFHMLRWAEIEATGSTVRAQEGKDLGMRRDSARRALGVVETALNTYPNERSLIESRTILAEMVVSIEMKGYVDEAEQAAFSGDYKTAKRAYRDALYCLGRDSIKNAERGLAAERINIELEKIRFAEQNSHS